MWRTLRFLGCLTSVTFFCSGLSCRSGRESTYCGKVCSRSVLQLRPLTVELLVNCNGNAFHKQGFMVFSIINWCTVQRLCPNVLCKLCRCNQSLFDIVLSHVQLSYDGFCIIAFLKEPVDGVVQFQCALHIKRSGSRKCYSHLYCYLG